MRHAIGVLAIVVGSTAIGCGLGGISRERAIQIAVQDRPGVVLSAEHGLLGRFIEPTTLPEEPRSREVWAVRIRGKVSISCPAMPIPRPCPDVVMNTLVVLDFVTGEFVLSESAGP